MPKYSISKDYGVFRYFKPPVSEAMCLVAAKVLLPPPFFKSNDKVTVEKRQIKSYDGYDLTVYVISPRGIKEPCPCLVNFHGGGFVFEGAPHHYRLAMLYAQKAECKAIYVKYRLAPKYKYPVAFEDCFAALKWTYENADELGIAPDNIGVGGDSAGGTLAAAVCHMNKDRQTNIPIRFQLLAYPFLDIRNSSESAKKYKDTPMWNSRLSDKVKPLILSGYTDKPVYLSPVEIENLSGLPEAYIETCEFDCLHDDGISYNKLLMENGIKTELFETSGTMHGYDIVLKAPVTLKAINKRTEYMKRIFSKENINI